MPQPRNPVPGLMLGLLMLAVTGCAPRMQLQEGGNAPSAPALTVNRLVTGDGTRLPLNHWRPDGPPRKVMLALHGFNDFSGAFESLADTLAPEGVALYAYDQRGFGATRQRGIWPGRERLVDDALTALTLLRARYPETPLYLAGESMGAAVVMLALTADTAVAVDGAILLAPAVWARDTQPWYQRIALWTGIRLFPGIRLDREWADIEPTDDPEVMAYWDTHPLVIRRTRLDALEGVTRLMDAAMAEVPALPAPLLMLYGGRDEVVPAGAICAMLRRLPDGAAGDRRFAYYPEGWHLLTRDLRADETLDDITAWLVDHEGALPSGRALSRERAIGRVCHGVD